MDGKNSSYLWPNPITSSGADHVTGQFGGVGDLTSDTICIWYWNKIVYYRPNRTRLLDVPINPLHVNNIAVVWSAIGLVWYTIDPHSSGVIIIIHHHHRRHALERDWDGKGSRRPMATIRIQQPYLLNSWCMIVHAYTITYTFMCIIYIVSSYSRYI